MNNHIQIFDTTLRDGEQSPGYSMNKAEKLQLAKQLERLGVDVIEAGFPIASDGDFETVKKIAETITESTVAGLCRTTPIDIETAAKAVENAAKPRIHTFIATSDIHMKYKLRMSREEVIESAVTGVKKARSYCDEVEFSAEDA
ncbi:MAG: 2-isopropylmalate synthase, partial [Balneolaceae bacterium]